MGLSYCRKFRVSTLQPSFLEQRGVGVVEVVIVVVVVVGVVVVVVVGVVVVQY